MQVNPLLSDAETIYVKTNTATDISDEADHVAGSWLPGGASIESAEGAGENGNSLSPAPSADAPPEPQGLKRWLTGPWVSSAAWVLLIVLAFALSWALGILLGGAGHVAPHWFYLPIFLAAMRFGPVGAAIGGIVATIVGGPLLPADVNTGTGQALSDWVSRGIFFCLLGQFVAQLMGQVSRTSAREARLVQERVEQLRFKRLLDRTISAGELERRRLAAEIHDGPVQRLTALDVTLQSVHQDLDPADLRGAGRVERVQGGLRQSIEELRTMMVELHPPALQERGLAAALADQLEDVMRSSGIQCRVEYRLDFRLDPSIETTVYRIVQEALMNVVKHAHAKSVLVSLETAGAEVRLKVRDDGVGFHTEKTGTGLRAGEHFGLIGMQERAEMVGGTWGLSSAPGVGTEVRVVLPLEVPA